MLIFFDKTDLQDRKCNVIQDTFMEEQKARKAQKTENVFINYVLELIFVAVGSY